MQATFHRIAFTSSIPAASSSLRIRTRTALLTTPRRPRSMRPSVTTTTTTTTRTKMTLPSIDALRNAQFPDSVEDASRIFMDACSGNGSGSDGEGGETTLSEHHRSLLSALLSTSPGARGVFVALLGDPSIPTADADPLDDGLVTICVQAMGREDGVDGGKDTDSQMYHVRELSVKNAVMPSAMVVTYRRRGEHELADGSLKTRERAVRLLKAWHVKEEEGAVGNGGEVCSPSVKEVARSMRDALTGQGGMYEPFVVKWEYGEEERAAMVESLNRVFGEDF